jgi:hypothetical protein
MCTKFFATREERDARQWEKNRMNPRYHNFNQRIYTAGDYEQFEDELKKVMQVPLNRNIPDVSSDWGSIDVPTLYTNIDYQDIVNTFKYIFYKFKKGIFVSFRNNRLACFLPFSNAHYINEYTDKLGNLHDSYREMHMSSKLAGKRYNKKRINGIVERWYANNSLVRNEFPIAENGTNLLVLQNFMEELAMNRTVPDVDFFINKRDFPLLVEGKYEPYNHLYKSKVHPLRSHAYSKYVPILTASKASRYSDIHLPTVDDWIRVSSPEGRFFPQASNDYHPFPERIDWEQKKDVAVWRGSSTGVGTNRHTNQRLKIAYMAMTEESLDAGITRWNTRIRTSETMTGYRTINNRGLKLVDPISFSDQARYKYIVHINGHVSAYRLGAELGLGSVILKVESEYSLWFESHLKPWVHYVPVKNDLSDLISQIDWLRKNDKRAMQIASNGVRFFETNLGKNGILDYMSNTLRCIAKAAMYTWHPKVELSRASRTGSEETVRTRAKGTLKWLGENDRPSHLCLNTVGRFLNTCCTTSDMKVVQQVFKNSHTSVEIVERFGHAFALKRGASRHEAVVGREVVNYFKSPVFNFTFDSWHGNEKGVCVLSQYQSGETMLSWITGRSYTKQVLVKTINTVLRALREAQRLRRFVHYDLTLGNIIMGPNGPVIVDFGRSRGVTASGHVLCPSSQHRIYSDVQDVKHLFVTLLYHMSRNYNISDTDVLDVAKIVRYIYEGTNVIVPCSMTKATCRYFTGIEAKYSRLLIHHDYTHGFDDIIVFIEKTFNTTVDATMNERPADTNTRGYYRDRIAGLSHLSARERMEERLPPGPPGPSGLRDGRIVVRHNLPVPRIPAHPDGDSVLRSLDSHHMIQQVMSSKFPNCKISDWTLDEFDIAWPAEKEQRQKFMQYLVYIRLRERIFDHMQVFGKFQ